MAFLCIYASLYVVLSVLCLPISLRAGLKHPEYFVLFLSVAFAGAGLIFAIFDLVIRTNGITPPQSRLLDTLIVLESFSTFLGDFSKPLLFLSICMVIRGRHLALHRPDTSNVFLIVYRILFALFMIFAIVHASYNAYYLSIVFSDKIARHTFAWIAQRARIVNDLSYTYSALFYSSAIVILSYVFIVGRQMRQHSFKDKVCCFHSSIYFQMLFITSCLGVEYNYILRRAGVYSMDRGRYDLNHPDVTIGTQARSNLSSNAD